MFRTAIPLGHWAGIRVGAHWSVFVVLVLIADLLASTVLPQAAPGETTTSYWVAAGLTAIGFLISLLLHELSHALVARRYGVGVKRITLWMLGGAAELEDEPPSPRADLRIAVAGPVASLVIGGTALGTAMLAARTLPPLPVGGLVWLGVSNLVLAVFNLLPGAPLDGGRILRALVWQWRGDRVKAVAVSAKAGQVLGALLGAAGLAQLILLRQFGGLWLMLLGWFLVFAAQAELTTGLLRERLEGLRVGDIMNPAPVIAPGWWTVDAFATYAAGKSRDRVYPVLSFDGVPIGIVSLGDLAHLSEKDRRVTRVADVARKEPTVTVADVDAPVTELMSGAFVGHGRDLVLVTKAAGLAGVVSAEDLARAVELAALGHAPRAANPDSAGDVIAG
ncbi:site-2 protease family protein [Amycolatopsis orientalis]|uniref:site-2 protease family protein n=1 Tax=Amycolatopsis orientalis TaxID=31958 RepID=UPI000416B3D4|nr:site-2 protease family protein [Amycolatopsis orientalis]